MSAARLGQARRGGEADRAAFTLAELAREAEREVVLREALYPTRIAAGKMRREQAARQIAMMREIARHLRAEDEGENPRRLL